MPLDRVNGEVIEGLAGSMHVVVDYRHLAAMSNVEVEFDAPGKFRPVKKRRQIFDDAAAIAAEAFQKAGAVLPVTLMPGTLRTSTLPGVATLSAIGLDPSGVLVQVYPVERKVAVVFCRRIGAPDATGERQEFYVTREYDVPRPVIESLLAAAGKRMPALN
jgi:hypothetical protein